jgi:hypothetical protein
VLTGESNRPKVKIGGVVARKRVVWTDRDVFAGADGLISPEVLPYENVTLRFSPATAGSKEASVPVVYDPSEGLYYPYKVAGETIIVRFAGTTPASMATASAGALIAAQNSGSWKADATRRVIRFGVERPVRLMSLQRSLDLAGFRMQEFYVRTSDNPGKQALPTDAPDSDEIVVTARGKGKQPRRLQLMVGMDRLAACSTISYRRSERILSLVC